MQLVIHNVKTDCFQFFEKSNILKDKDRLSHTPFLVFLEKDDVMELVVISNLNVLLRFPNQTKVIAQWPGKNRSDFFRFTIGQLKKFLYDNNMWDKINEF